jgi:putative ABC transport system permease protein
MLSATVVITLALAIGANTAIFSFVNALLIRPFPFADPDQLVEIHSVRGGQQGKLSMREVLDIREHIGILSDVAAHSGGAGGYNFGGAGKAEEWRAVLTTGNLFEVLGVPLEMGAKWPDAANRERDYRVILSHGVWQSAFGGSRDVVGSKISLDHAEGYEIHGVARAGFDFPRGTQVYRSIGGFTNYERRVYRNVVAIARIKRPHSVARLQAELDSLGRQLAGQYPDTNAGLAFRAVSFRQLYSGEVRPYLLLLSCAVGLVLLIACGNVLNLLLSRGLERNREMSIRLALGARQGHLVVQSLAESLVLAVLSGAAGLGLGWWWMKILRGMIGAEMPTWMAVELDGRVLLFTLFVSLLASLMPGLAPAWIAGRSELSGALKESTRGGSASQSSRRLRDVMVVGEITVAVILLTGAGLLIRGFLQLQESDKGFRSAGISTFRVALGWKRYIDQERIAGYYEQALRNLSSIPGISLVAFAPKPPMTRQEESAPGQVEAEGQSADEMRTNPYVTYQSISEEYFSLMGIPLLSGRLFNSFDNTRTDPVAIVSRRLAERLWPGQDPLGRRIRTPTGRRNSSWLTVVGVSGNVSLRQLGGEAGYEVFYPYRQSAESNQYMLARTVLPPAEFQRKAEQAMASIDPEQSVFEFKSLDQRILDGIWQLRLSRTLLMLFGAVALVLAAIGMYGVISFSVDQQQREIGIRLALGATPHGIRLLIVGRALRLCAVGIGFGVPGAWGLSRLLASSIQSLPPLSVAGLSAVIALLLGIGLLAAFIPALRAASTNPVEALRQE